MRAADFPYLDAPRPVGLAHRGGAEYEPNRGLENSMAAFRAAVEMGYRYLETDVHATSDGEVLAFHDRRLNRVTDAKGRIARTPYAVVSQALIGGNQQVPRLSDLLEEFPDIRINVDVKAAPAIEPLARVIKQHNAIDRVCVASFSERRLHAVRRALGPRLATAAGTVGIAALRLSPGLLDRLAVSPAPVFQVPGNHMLGGRQIRVVTPELVERVHRLGKHIHVWTIDDPQEMRDLLDLGVDGIVSDRIDTLRDVLAERGVPLRH